MNNINDAIVWTIRALLLFALVAGSWLANAAFGWPGVFGVAWTIIVIAIILGDEQ